MVKNIASFVILLSVILLIPSSLYGKDNSYTLYYSNEEATDVTSIASTISVEITSREQLYALLFYKLKEQPQASNLHSAVPWKVNLKHMTLDKDGTLQLDFNDEIMNIGSISGEFIFLKAVNYTFFANFPEVKKIYYSVNGERLQSLSHMDISSGFTRNNMK